MGLGAFLLNGGRVRGGGGGGLGAAVKEGRVAGAAIDVFPQEPESNGPGFETPLRGLANVVLTPHIGGATAEAQEATGREGGTTLTRFVNMGVTTGPVNFPQADMPPTPRK